MKSVILLSGGLDSSTALVQALNQGKEVYAISFDYGQRHNIELERVKLLLADYPQVTHKILTVDLRAFGGSALTSDIEVPEYESREKISPEVTITYVPARNTIFLSLALGYAESVGAREIIIGAHKDDYNNYPDCRPEFLRAFEEVARLGTACGSKGELIKIHTPFLMLEKSEIIQIGLSLGIDYSKTNSCYNPDENGASCGKCMSCNVRLESFKKANAQDTVLYKRDAA